MRPRLGAHLLPNRRRKAPTPAPTGESSIHIVPRGGVHQIGARAQVVVHGGQLDQLAQEGDGAARAEVLVPDDGFADGFCLGLGGGGNSFCCCWGCRGCSGEQGEGGDGAVEIEGEVGGGEEGGGGADVVEEAG